MHPLNRNRLFSAALVALSAGCCGNAFAHAFPEQETPGAGAALAQPPAVVSIRFDSDLEPVFSKLVVKSAQGTPVSQGNGSVDPHNPRYLSARLMNAGKGIFHVYWRAVARDGHHTEGDYTFTVR